MPIVRLLRLFSAVFPAKFLRFFLLGALLALPEISVEGQAEPVKDPSQTWAGWQVIGRVILPALAPAWLTGFAMAFARAVGEYGSVIFIAGNMPYRSEIAPLLITIQLEQYDYVGAASIAVVMLAASFAMLFVINTAQSLARRYGG